MSSNSTTPTAHSGPADCESATSPGISVIRSFVPQGIHVDCKNHVELMPIIIEAISRAAYVAIDLEMSGINLENCETSPLKSRITSEEAYDNAKRVARKFTILQVGLTITRLVNDEFECQTYHLKLSPFIMKEPKNFAASNHLANRINRLVSFSTQSLSFLEEHGFDIMKALSEGVPYLSRREREAYEVHVHGHVSRFAGSSSPTQEGREVAEFCATTKDKLTQWHLAQIQGKGEPYINIHAPNNADLNRFQIRLIHDMVRDQFPQCVCKTMMGGIFVQVTMKNATTAALTQGRTVADRRRAVGKNVGMSLIFEALAGGQFTEFFEHMWQGLPDGKITPQLRSRVLESQTRLAKRRPIIVAHNCLFDLCFIYNTFFGALPESLSDFKKSVSELFPRILDTKYLFVKGANSMSSETSLETCFAKCEENIFPRMYWVMPSCAHSRSLRSSGAHDAGYDSYMTAIILIKQGYLLANPGMQDTVKPSPGRHSASDSPSSESGRCEPRLSELKTGDEMEDPEYEEYEDEDDKVDGDEVTKADPFWNLNPFKGSRRPSILSSKQSVRSGTASRAPRIRKMKETPEETSEASESVQQASSINTTDTTSELVVDKINSTTPALLSGLNPAAQEFKAPGAPYSLASAKLGGIAPKNEKTNTVFNPSAQNYYPVNSGAHNVTPMPPCPVPVNFTTNVPLAAAPYSHMMPAHQGNFGYPFQGQLSNPMPSHMQYPQYLPHYPSRTGDRGLFTPSQYLQTYRHEVAIDQPNVFGAFMTTPHAWSHQPNGGGSSMMMMPGAVAAPWNHANFHQPSPLASLPLVMDPKNLSAGEPDSNTNEAANVVHITCSKDWQRVDTLDQTVGVGPERASAAVQPRRTYDIESRMDAEFMPPWNSYIWEQYGNRIPIGVSCLIDFGDSLL